MDEKLSLRFNSNLGFNFVTTHAHTHAHTHTHTECQNKLYHRFKSLAENTTKDYMHQVKCIEKVNMSTL